MASGKPTLEDAVAAICRIPVELRARGNVSWNDLKEGSGYSTHREEITEKRLEDYLRSHPELLEAWVSFSEDQRCNPSWWIGPPDPGINRRAWTVGYHDETPTPRNVNHAFEDSTRACAFFIQRLLELP